MMPANFYLAHWPQDKFGIIVAGVFLLFCCVGVIGLLLKLNALDR